MLLHSALGLRPGVHAAADILRAAGHTVVVPDYYDGEVFDEVEDGLRKRDALGVEEIRRRVRRFGESVDRPVVFAGFSLGAAAAGTLAASHPSARGLILMHGAVADDALAGPWPAGVPVQVHYGEGDPWVEPATVAELERLVTASGAAFEVHTYPTDAHLFADPGLPDYDPCAATLMWQRVTEFLKRISD